MEEMKQWRSPAPEFEYCGFYGELPITQHYFNHYAMEELQHQAHDGSGGGGRGLYMPAVASAPSDRRCGTRRKGGKRSGDEKRRGAARRKEQQGKQGRVCSVATAESPPAVAPRAGKAVDEDLYKIPPELLRRKPSREKRTAWRFFPGCLSCHCC